MNFIICDSKGWFALDQELLEINRVVLIKKKENLNFKDLKKIDPKYIFFIHWNWKVKEEIYKNFNCILFHTAPLPYGRGGSPIQNLILREHKSAPVCALKMVEELDAGPIYSKFEISLEGNLTKIFSRLSEAINKLIKEIINKKIKPKKQSGETLLFKRLNKKDNEIPSDIDIQKFYDYIRMLDHESYPNAYIKYGRFKIEFFNANNEKEFLKVNCKITECE